MPNSKELFVSGSVVDCVPSGESRNVIVDLLSYRRDIVPDSRGLVVYGCWLQ